MELCAPTAVGAASDALTTPTERSAEASRLARLGDENDIVTSAHACLPGFSRDALVNGTSHSPRVPVRSTSRTYDTENIHLGRATLFDVPR